MRQFLVFILSLLIATMPCLGSYTPLYSSNSKIYVEQNGSDSNSGLDDFHALATLTNALAVAEANNINDIHAGVGYYYLTNLLILPVGMTLEGSGNGNAPTLPHLQQSGLLRGMRHQIVRRLHWEHSPELE